MQDSIEIRPAQPDDAEVAALLLRSAYMHIQVAYPPVEDPESGWGGRLQRYFRQDGNRFSYQSTFVAEQSAEVVGLVLSFGGRDEGAARRRRLAPGSNERRRTTNGTLTRLPSSPIGVARALARASCGRRSHRRASVTIPKSR